jgi:hypothetical protein
MESEPTPGFLFVPSPPFVREFYSSGGRRSIFMRLPWGAAPGRLPTVGLATSRRGPGWPALRRAPL